jgi:NTE family protein
MDNQGVKSDYENLVFEAGGVKGVAYFGAILELEKRGLLSQFKRFGGTSSGSIFAAMLAIGFTADELYNWKDVLSYSKASVKCYFWALCSLFKRFGMKDVSVVTSQVAKKMSEKVDTNITFGQLYEKTGKDLVIVVCNVNRRRPVYIHHAQFPDVKVIDAIGCSVCAPYIFRPKKYDWLGTEDYYTDGGISDSYPNWVYNDLEKLYAGETNQIDTHYISDKTLGIKLLAGDESNDYEVFKGREEVSSVVDFTSGVLNTLVYQVERSVISDSYIRQTICIDTQETGAFNFDLNDEERENLVQSGIRGVKAYFKN